MLVVMIVLGGIAVAAVVGTVTMTVCDGLHRRLDSLS
jgi:hypothetical protein